MPKGIGYGRKKGKRKLPRHRRPSPKAKGSRKAHKGHGMPPERKQRIKGKLSPVTGLRRFKKKRRTLKKL